MDREQRERIDLSLIEDLQEQLSVGSNGTIPSPSSINLPTSYEVADTLLIEGNFFSYRNFTKQLLEITPEQDKGNVSLKLKERFLKHYRKGILAVIARVGLKLQYVALAFSLLNLLKTVFPEYKTILECTDISCVIENIR